MATRRDFLKTAGAALGTAAAGLAGAETAGASERHLDPDRLGVLTDTTLCIGCRRCEWACSREHDLPHGEIDEYVDSDQMPPGRRPTVDDYTVVNHYPAGGARGLPLDVKFQCMHCDHPPCVSACLVTALQKDPRGPVVYDAARCIGCRYCMVACPFQIPAYEYGKAVGPRVMKCNMCAQRTLTDGRAPACVSICPVEALTFGRREDLLTLAHARIRENPSRYVPKVYGEHDGGGTSWLMLADRDFAEVDMPELADESPAALTERLQHGIFKGFSGPIMLVGLLAILMKSSSDAAKYHREEEEDDE